MTKTIKSHFYCRNRGAITEHWQYYDRTRAHARRERQQGGEAMGSGQVLH